MRERITGAIKWFSKGGKNPQQNAPKLSEESQKLLDNIEKLRESQNIGADTMLKQFPPAK